MKERMKRLLALVVACCLVIGLPQVPSYAHGNSADDTQRVPALSESEATATSAIAAAAGNSGNKVAIYASGDAAEAASGDVAEAASDEEDDEDKVTSKDIISITYEDEEGNEYTRMETDGTNPYVYEGDQIHYIISRYNNTSESVTFVIVDTLDEGVNYTYSSTGSTYYSQATDITVGSDSYSIPARSVAWTISAEPHSYATVQLTVAVNSTARAATQTYDAKTPGTTTTDADVETVTNFTYGESNTTASVANQAAAYTVGTTIVSYSKVIENPLGKCDPVEPVMTEPACTVSVDSDSTVDEDGNVEDTNENGSVSDETVTYETVAVSEVFGYQITYYNHYNKAAVVTITDKLDEDVRFVSASNNGTYDGGTHTVTWTINNVTPLTGGTVELRVQALSSAISDDPDEPNIISNRASVTIKSDGDEYEADTNTVENPVAGEYGDPMMEVSDKSAAGVGGVNVQVGDEITYAITYYNQNSEEATITIVDTLDEKMELVDATDKEGNSLYATPVAGAVAKLTAELNGTVTWTFTAEAYETGIVTITLKVQDGAAGGTVSNDASVQVGSDEAVFTNIVVNPVDDSPQTPVKTVTTINGIETTDPRIAGDTYTYGDVGEGDTITYTISYYNHYAATGTVTITDPLDPGVTYDSSSDNGEYDSDSGTVSWTIEDVPACTDGTVTLTVRVNNTAKTIDTDDAEATVDNQATVTVTEDKNSVESVTNIVVNPLKDDASRAPAKTLETVIDENGNARTASDVYGNLYVSVGDQVTYSISYYNNLNEVADVIIADVLDEGVDFVALKDGDGNVLDGNYDETAHTVSYTARDVAPFGEGILYLTVKVNENARTSANTYSVSQDPDSDYSLIYGVDGDTTASIANQASATVVSATVGSRTTFYSSVVENPLEDDPSEDPVMTETSETVPTSGSKTVDGTVYTTLTYEDVSVGDVITYNIDYYNNHAAPATITIEDVLDEGVDLVFASLGETYSCDEATGIYTWTMTDGTVTYEESTRTITWKLTAELLTRGTVSFQAAVNSSARTTTTAETTATVENQATVYNDKDEDGGATGRKTNIVMNAISADEPSDPENEVSADSEAGMNGANVAVGDEITYTISYYNYNNTAVNVLIEDALDTGTDFVSASCGDTVLDLTDADTYTYDESNGTYTATGANVTITYDTSKHTVVWTINDVSAFTAGTVSLTVRVNESACGETVENAAEVTIGEAAPVTTVRVGNPVDDEPEDPTLTETGCGDGTVDENGDITYDEVAVGDEITYIISYYNYYGTEAEITITDRLDPGVDFVSATDQDGNTLASGNVFTDEDDTCVKWPVFTAEAYESGFVTLIVRVTEAAKTADADGNITVDNQASVKIGSDSAVSSNMVTNSLEADAQTEPTSEGGEGGTTENTTEESGGESTTTEENTTEESSGESVTTEENTTEGSGGESVTTEENTAEVSAGDTVSTDNAESSAGQETASIVNTGDSSLLFHWILLLIASAAVFGTMFLAARKREGA